MIRYEEINDEWRRIISRWNDHSSVTYEKNGIEMFGVVKTYYTPDTPLLFFKTGQSGFRYEITEKEYTELISKIC